MAARAVAALLAPLRRTTTDLLQAVDALLRGRFTRASDLRDGRIPVPARRLVLAALALGVAYGLFMGLYAVMRPTAPSAAQMAATAVKVPLLFLLTLAVTCPSLYVFSALSGSRLGFRATLRLLLAAVAVNLALLASFGPVTGFFTLSTASYPFMVLLNVAFFAVSGWVGLRVLRRALGVVFARREASLLPGGAASEELPAGGSEPGADVDPVEPDEGDPRLVRRIFGTWILIYAVVGAQMGWILRPFVGTPGQPFEMFRERESNFFAAFLDLLRSFFS